ncbi:YybH family protein [Sphingomonas sp.]|uniref:YybH family protein n=1 Tax=Sphingomonas sp. TaxID=28214 RepID=UPI002DEB0617|nr:nuclear transport factor 2 family protein [Sphingomonas sp.]
MNQATLQELKMKLASLMGLVALAMAQLARAAEPSAVDRAALLALADKMDRAWTAADVNENSALFSADATARFGNDPLGEGREAIQDQFRTFFADRPPNLRHVTRIDHIELLSPDLAMWDAEVSVEQRQPSGAWLVQTRIQNLTLATRQPQGWKVRAVGAFPVR